MNSIDPSGNSRPEPRQWAATPPAVPEARKTRQEPPQWGAIASINRGGEIRSRLLGIATANVKHPAGERRSNVGPEALMTFMVAQPWFVKNKPVASVNILSERQLSAPEDSDKLVLLGVNVRFADGTKEYWLAPARIDSQGELSDALSSSAFRKATLALAERGEHLDAQTEAARRRLSRLSLRPSRADRAENTSGTRRHIRSEMRRDTELVKRLAQRMPHRATGNSSVKKDAAALRRALCGEVKSDGARSEWSGIEAYTTPERYRHVVEQAKILSPNHADKIVVNFFRKVRDAVDAQPQEVRDFYKALVTRPKFEPIFYGYAHHIAVPDGKKEGTFNDLADALATIGELGFHALEIMPHYESPMMDSGYDISDHRTVQDALGGDEEYAAFMNAAVESGIRVAIDLVVNHVSHEHPWVKAIAAGDESMLPRFIHWDDAVKIGERKIGEEKVNVFLHLRGEHAGKLTHAFQCFPDNNPDTLVEIGPAEARHKLYLTFMSPYQFDVNTAHPDVVGYLLDTIATFSRYGNNDLRVDAPVHTWKQPGTFSYNLPQTQTLTSLVKSFAAHVTGGSNTILSEVFMPWEKAEPDWLSPEKNFDGTIENTVSDALIGFSLHEAILHTLLSEDKRSWIQAQEELGDLPAHKSVLAYLGLHDESFVTDPDLVEELVARGATKFSARIGDASAELLQHDSRRLAMAYALLYGSKGYPAVYYRGIVGAPNNTKFFEEKRQERFNDLKPQGPLGKKEEEALLLKAADTRDLDRGPTALREYKEKFEEGYLPMVTVRALNALWREHGSIRANDIDEVPNRDNGIVSLARRASDSDDPPLLQLVNLTNENKVVELELDHLERQLGWSSPKKLVDLLGSKIKETESAMQFHVEDRTLRIKLSPYGALYLESRNP